MRHNIHAEGFGIRFRPVQLQDAAFVVWLRSQEYAQGKIGDSATDVRGQELWFQNYFDRPDDYYFLIETAGGLPIGTHGFYDFENGTAETGRWVLRLGMPAAAASVLLALDVAFRQLGLAAVRARTVATNLQVLSIHRKIGFRQTGFQPKALVIQGRPVNMVLSVLTAADGAVACQRLLPPARRAEARIYEWERDQKQRSGPVPWFYLYSPGSEPEALARQNYAA